MSAALVLHDNGTWSAEVPDHHGEVVAYGIRRLRPGLDVFAVQMERLDSQESYRVSLNRLGTWRCLCPDFTHRRKDGVKVLCKHARAARALWRLLTDLGEAHERSGSNSRGAGSALRA